MMNENETNDAPIVPPTSASDCSAKLSPYFVGGCLPSSEKSKSDAEKVAIFESHLHDIPWGYAHQEYCVPKEEPTLFARVFLWPRLWNWLRIHNKTEVEIALLLRIAREMGYDYQEPNPTGLSRPATEGE